MIIIGKSDLVFDVAYFFGKQKNNQYITLTTDFENDESLSCAAAQIKEHPGEVLVCTQSESAVEQRLSLVGAEADRDYRFFSALQSAFNAVLNKYGVNADESERLWDIYRSIFYAPHGKYYPCHHPLYEAEISESGNVYTCCSAVMPFALGNIRDNTFKALWHSPKARLLRLTTLNGTAVFCSRERCGNLHRCEEKFQVKSEQVSDYPLTLNIAVDPTCNLSCPSCREGHIYESNESVCEKIGWLEKLDDELYRNVRDIYVAGNGECMVSRVYERYLLEQLPSRFAGRLHLLTNGQIWNDEIINAVTSAFCPEVLLSIDAGSKAAYETIRRGGQYDRLVLHLKKYIELKAQGKISCVVVRFVVQKANYTEIPQFIDNMRELGVDRIEFTRLVQGDAFTNDSFKDASLLNEDGVLRKEYVSFFKDNVWPRLNSDIAMDSAYLLRVSL